MRLSIITVVSLATSSLALALVPRDDPNALSPDHNPGGGGGGGKGGEKGGECPAGGGGGKGGGGKGGGGLTECKSFSFRAKGSVSGSVGQLESGQLRIGLEPVKLRMDRGEVIDSMKRGCWWTPPTETLQCDVGQQPEAGFEVGCDGKVKFKDQTRFFQCEAENQQYNIYKKDGQGANCAEVTLYAMGCGGKGEGGGGGGEKPKPEPKPEPKPKPEKPKPMPEPPSNGTSTSNGTATPGNGTGSPPPPPKW
ncbi:PAP2 superfamily protein [Colletotrichum plurivorum]|uniref:PAP2 superfamily protein n=1 Tax=Colletotrichum plurivorum TaxID=2175906 RepID=A0A8H6KG26_9PEZI|nr:PAP2 superfamily protein [Colletotrichum plurivorum]